MIDAINGAPVKSSAGKFCGWNTIFGRDGEKATPYMTRIWFGRLRIHIFHRGDSDPDCHDHPWDFWTFPLTSYVEQVAKAKAVRGTATIRHEFQIVPAWRVSFRPATHCHRVIAPYIGPKPETDLRLYAEGRALHPTDLYGQGKIITIVWRGALRRKWGFLKNRDGQWCWVGWKEYVIGGKRGPCE